MSAEPITPATLNQRLAREECRLLDVRTPAEFQEVHVPGAENVPLDRLNPAQLCAEGRCSKDSAVFLLCRSGGRAKQAAAKFVEAGFKQVFIVDGGTQAWEQAGLPVNRGRKVMSLERQVRIAAGSLVLMGVGLGFFVHPGFLGLAAFVGAGLVFAGVTDTCGMGMLLARMPWNQVAAPACPSPAGGSA